MYGVFGIFLFLRISTTFQARWQNENMIRVFLQRETNNQTEQNSHPVSKWASKWKDRPKDALNVITRIRLLVLYISIRTARFGVVS